MAFDPELGKKVSVDLVRIYKLLHALKGSIPRFHDAVEQTNYPLLLAVHEAPARITALAERTHSDASVVSRQVRHLEQHGLVAKSSDPADGRASLVTLTDSGREVVERIFAGRGEWFSRMLADWTPEEATALDIHLGRLAAALERELATCANPNIGPATAETAAHSTTHQENR